MIAEADAVLASGHMPPRSIIAVFEAAKEAGVRRMIVNHPNFVIEATKVGAISRAQLREIAEKKMSDLNATTIEAAEKTIAGTARSMGITVEG